MTACWQRRTILEDSFSTLRFAGKEAVYRSLKILDGRMIEISEKVNLRPAEGGAAGRARAVPELLAPAGDWECAKAAVENGADAIYFGLEKFNARLRAHNFTEADLPRLMGFL